MLSSPSLFSPTFSTFSLSYICPLFPSPLPSFPSCVSRVSLLGVSMSPSSAKQDPFSPSLFPPLPPILLPLSVSPSPLQCQPPPFPFPPLLPFLRQCVLSSASPSSGGGISFGRGPAGRLSLSTVISGLFVGGSVARSLSLPLPRR